MSFLQSKHGTPKLTWLLAEAATPEMYAEERSESPDQRDVNFQVMLDVTDDSAQLLYEVDVNNGPLIMRLKVMESFHVTDTFSAEDEAHIGEHIRQSAAIPALNQQMNDFGSMFGLPHPVIDPAQI